MVPHTMTIYNLVYHLQHPSIGVPESVRGEQYEHGISRDRLKVETLIGSRKCC